MIWKHINIKLKGNTLIEVLVASCILLFVSAISGLIYMNVLRNSSANIQFKAQQIIEADYNNLQQTKSLTEKVFTNEGIKITKQIVALPNIKNTFKISYTVDFDNQSIYHTYYLYSL
jgi:Tfp pilus assembly protein PilV